MRACAFWHSCSRANHPALRISHRYGSLVSLQCSLRLLQLGLQLGNFIRIGWSTPVSPVLLQLLLGSLRLLTELLHALIWQRLGRPGWHLWLASPGCIPLPDCLLQGIFYLLQSLFGSVRTRLMILPSCPGFPELFAVKSSVRFQLFDLFFQLIMLFLQGVDGSQDGTCVGFIHVCFLPLQLFHGFLRSLQLLEPIIPVPEPVTIFPVLGMLTASLC